MSVHIQSSEETKKLSDATKRLPLNPMLCLKCQRPLNAVNLIKHQVGENGAATLEFRCFVCNGSQLVSVKARHTVEP